MTNETHSVVPVFFACDDAYAPFLDITLESMRAFASPDRTYRVHILTSNMSSDNRRRIESLADSHIQICFEEVEERLRDVAQKLHVRDYYSITTYYRMFIADWFPQYDKVLYIDADTVFNSDVAELYDVDLGDCLVAAAQEDVMATEPVFGRYVEVVLGVPRADYFSAGVLVMNLDLFRKERLCDQFLELLGRCKYEVTQDQDYLNVLCRDRVLRLGYEWNCSPSEVMCHSVEPKLIHYKLLWKPWHYSGTRYEDYFWKYADGSEYADEVRAMKNDFTEERAAADRQMYRNLMGLAARHMAQYGEDFEIDRQVLYHA